MDRACYSLKAAAAALKVDDHTIKTWLKREGIVASKGHCDNRTSCVLRHELLRLAHIHHRAIDINPDEPTVASLAERLDKLEQAFFELQETLQQMGREPIAQVWRAHVPSAQTTRPHSVTAEEIAKEAIQLIDSAPAQLLQGKESIVITFQGDVDLFSLISPELRRDLLQALHQAIRAKRWGVVYVIGQTANLDRTMHIVEGLINTLGTLGRLFSATYVALDPASDGARPDYILVPGKGALQMTLSRQSAQHTRPLLHLPGDGYERIVREVQAMRERGTSLVHAYNGHTFDFHRTITEIDSLPSARYVVQEGLSDLTIPPWLRQQRRDELERKLRAGSAHDPQAVLDKVRQAEGIRATHADRTHQFERLVATHSFRDICPMHAILDYLHTGEYSSTDWFRQMGCAVVTRAERKQHLEFLIEERLNKYPRYELALIGDGDLVDPGMYRTFWLVKAQHTVLLECLTAPGQDLERQLNLRISEPDVVNGFYTYSERLWNRLHPDHRDKAWVTDWLRQRIEEIP